jgi:hypothetical protein
MDPDYEYYGLDDPPEILSVYERGRFVRSGIKPEIQTRSETTYSDHLYDESRERVVTITKVEAVNVEGLIGTFIVGYEKIDIRYERKRRYRPSGLTLEMEPAYSTIYGIKYQTFYAKSPRTVKRERSQ